MNSAFYYTETYFSLLDISSAAKHSFGKGGKRNQMRFSSLWPCHTTFLSVKLSNQANIFSSKSWEVSYTKVLWRTLIHSEGEKMVFKNIRSFLGRCITSHLSLFLLALLWTLTLPFWILPWILSCCSPSGREGIPFVVPIVPFGHKKVVKY